jgi:nucleoside-diphosphate-sugar epimerase
MRIFITGGTGFIGKFTVKALAKDHDLLVYVSDKKRAQAIFKGFDVSVKRIRFASGTLANTASLETILLRFKPEAALHLAWEGIPNFDSKNSTKNLVQSLNLIQLLAKVGCGSFLGVGSCWEYGAKKGKLNENIPSVSSSAFTEAKNSLRSFGSVIAKENGMRFIWARLFFVYGPGQRAGSLIPSIIKTAQLGQKPKLQNPNGANDFIYVEDVAKALKLLLVKTRVPEGVYNIGSGRLTSVLEVSREVLKLYGASNLRKLPRRSEIEGFYADIKKIKKATGWSPAASIKTGVGKTVNYYKNSPRS